MNCINDLNTGEVKGGSVHLDAQTVMRLKQYRIDHINHHPDQPLPGAAQFVCPAVNAWLDKNGFASGGELGITGTPLRRWVFAERQKYPSMKKLAASVLPRRSLRKT